MLSKKAPVGETCSMKCRLLVFEKEMQVLVHVPSGSHDAWNRNPDPVGCSVRRAWRWRRRTKASEDCALFSFQKNSYSIHHIEFLDKYIEY